MGAEILRAGLLIVDAVERAQAAGLPARTAVTIGNFDGCHRGHQALASAACAVGERLGAAPIALTFRPRPEAYFRRLERDRLLFTPAQKRRAFAELGLAAMVEQAFDEPFSRIEARAFVTDCLMKQLGAAAVVVGHNFRFGRGREGSSAWLADHAEELGLSVTVCPPCEDHAGTISSSRVRDAVERGDVAAAASLLGRPYLLEGRIVQGDRLGRTLGFPTANLGEVAQIVPAHGVYAVRVVLGESPIFGAPPDALIGACSIGLRPTLGLAEPELRVETYILDGAFGPDELYGRQIGLYFEARLRDDLKLPSLDALKTQIARDIDDVRRRLSP